MLDTIDFIFLKVNYMFRPSTLNHTWKQCTIQKRYSSSKALMKSSSSQFPPSLLEYPWLASISPPRQPPPSIWQSIKQKHFLKLGLKKASKCFHGYDFPRQFLIDGAKVCEDVFTALSDPTKAGSIEELKPYMSLILAQKYAEGYQNIIKQGLIPKFILHSKPKLHLTGIHLTYGPYPPPPDYVLQDWWSVMTLVIPPEEAYFDSVESQNEILKSASEDGVFIRIAVQVNADVELRLDDSQTGENVFKDSRPSIQLEFTTPHFGPWDEVVELDSTGNWKLRWQWRITDTDALIKSQDPHMHQSPRIDWSLPIFKKQEADCLPLGKEVNHPQSPRIS